jgi:hypothetical protein
VPAGSRAGMFSLPNFVMQWADQTSQHKNLLRHYELSSLVYHGSTVFAHGTENNQFRVVTRRPELPRPKYSHCLAAIAVDAQWLMGSQLTQCSPHCSQACTELPLPGMLLNCKKHPNKGAVCGSPLNWVRAREHTIGASTTLMAFRGISEIA